MANKQTKRATKKPTAKRPAAKQGAARKPKATKPAAAKERAAKKMGPRADLGAPIDGFFGKQPPQLRAILDELRRLVEQAAPEADSSLKWGMPFFTIDGRMMCALAGFKAHVNLILFGPTEVFADPEGRLEGGGKAGRHLKLRSLDELPREAVRAWLRAAAGVARGSA